MVMVALAYEFSEVSSSELEEEELFPTSSFLSETSIYSLKCLILLPGALSFGKVLTRGFCCATGRSMTELVSEFMFL